MKRQHGERVRRALGCCSVSALPLARAPSSAIRSRATKWRSASARRCSRRAAPLCHGPDAKGQLGPDLTQRWARGETDESAFLIIRNGVPGSSMPPNSAPDNELWAIVAHLRSISVMPPLVEHGRREPRPRACSRSECSAVIRYAARVGRSARISRASAPTRSRAALTAALRDPSATVALGFRGVTVETRRGERVEGVVKSEDAFSLQVVTVDGELRAFREARARASSRAARSR